MSAPKRLVAPSPQFRRHYSFYPPPEPFHSPRVRPPPTSSSAGVSKSSRGPPPISSLSTFGATPGLLSHYLAIPPTQLTLSSLLGLGGSPGVPPRESQLLHSARFTAKELPVRLARRVDQYRSLPFIVGSNPYISKIAKLYASSFDSLASLSEIKTLQDNARFAEKLDEMVSLHSENIPTLARGFLECKRYMSSSAISAFLDGAIHSRIGIRLIGEQHLALSHAHSTGKAANPASVGIIDTKVNAYQLIRNCADFVGELCESTLGVKPELRIEGDREATFVGVASHLVSACRRWTRSLHIAIPHTTSRRSPVLLRHRAAQEQLPSHRRAACQEAGPLFHHSRARLAHPTHLYLNRKVTHSPLDAHS